MLVIASWSIFIMDVWKFLLDNYNIFVIVLLASTDCFFILFESFLVIGMNSNL